MNQRTLRIPQPHPPGHTGTAVRWAPALLLALTAALHAAQFGDFRYTSSGTEVTITGYTGPGGAVTVPEVIGGFPVITIGGYAFAGCDRLTNVTIPGNVWSIGTYAFNDVAMLQGLYFEGRPPEFGSGWLQENVTRYFLAGTVGWGQIAGPYPTVLWFPQVRTQKTPFGVHEGHSGFEIFWARNKVVVVEACADLGNPDWVQAGIHTLTENVVPFIDPEAADRPARFYRLREQ